MTSWSPQRFKTGADKSDVDENIVAHALSIAALNHAVNPNLPPVFSLRHLAHYSGADYGFLRKLVQRANVKAYRTYRIGKRPSFEGDVRYRNISVPNPQLMDTQRWVCQSILAHLKPHQASMAYSKGNTIYAAALPHCGAEWMIKLDVQNFFESINEIAVYRVFRNAGYQALPAFEMARLCTRLRRGHTAEARGKWKGSSGKAWTIKSYQHSNIGYLPQGAPTSPMLANLVAETFDAKVSYIATQHGLIFTRYADDLTLSTKSKAFSRKQCGEVIKEIYRAMLVSGFKPNITKTQVSPPGSRKVVLGLIVSGILPTLTRDFKATMRRHIYYLTHKDHGPTKHAAARTFVSTDGLRNHIQGLLSYAKQVEPHYGSDCEYALKSVQWPA